jgi:hypothetical protein
MPSCLLHVLDALTVALSKHEKEAVVEDDNSEEDPVSSGDDDDGYANEINQQKIQKKIEKMKKKERIRLTSSA